MKTTEAINRLDVRKAELATILKALPKLAVDEKMRLALQLGCSQRKIERYMDGDVRIASFGEVLLKAVQEITSDSNGSVDAQREKKAA